MIGSAKAAIFNLKPSSDTIQAVTVVPMLAPMTSPKVCVKLNNPALANETTSTVVALEDCTAHVITKPLKTPAKRLRVSPARTDRSREPAIF